MVSCLGMITLDTDSQVERLDTFFPGHIIGSFLFSLFINKAGTKRKNLLPSPVSVCCLFNDMISRKNIDFCYENSLFRPALELALILVIGGV